MKRIHLVIVVVLMLGALIFAYSQKRQVRSPQAPQVASRMTNDQRLQRTITTQQRINRYFHSNVMPKVRNCWSRVQGRGTIEIEHAYTKDASGKWIVNKLTVRKSTLPRGQDAVALQCMQVAVRGTSFPVEGDDGDSKQYAVRWTWPVPFPANAAEQTRAMFAARAGSGGAGGTGGCDGHGATPVCVTCGGTNGQECFAVCVGGDFCAGFDKGACRAYGKCASGGPFGLVGDGVSIY